MKRLIVYLLLMNTAHICGGNNDISERMSYFLTELCPGSNICRGNVSSNIDNLNNLDSDVRLCCTDCSCAPNCENTGNCCFVNNIPPQGKKTKDVPRTSDDVGHIQCLYPVTGETEVTDFKNFHSYHMISSISQEDNSDQFEAEECSHSKMGPWGSMFPVFSKQANAIYKNELCAKLDNVNDEVVWEARLSCTVYKPEKLQAHLERGLMPKECRVQFSYPGDFKDIEPLKCYRDMVNVCTSTDFEVPVSINATKDDILEACQGGLVSPYYGNKYSLYANVFCHICSGSPFDGNPKCSGIRSEKGPSGNSVLGLLNIDELYSLKESEAKYVPNRIISTACPTNSKQKTIQCRPMLCPSGQVRGTNGRCVFPMQQWLQQTIHLLLELNSEQEFDITKAFDFQKGFFTSTNIESLSVPNSLNLKYWTVINGFYKVENPNNRKNTKCLLLFLSRFFRSISPINIMKNVDLLLITNWSLNYGTEKVILKPSILNMYFPDLDNSTSHFKENETLSIQRPFYQIFYESRHGRETAILITKLSFCEQIELRIGEYYLSEDQMVLYNKVAKQYLFNGEFVVLSDFSEETVRICLEGSGFARSNATSCSTTVSVAVLFVFLALKVLLADAHGV